MATGHPTVLWTCDRCATTQSRLLTEPPDKPANWWHITRAAFDTARTGTTREADLCDECDTDLIKFLDNQPIDPRGGDR